MAHSFHMYMKIILLVLIFAFMASMIIMTVGNAGFLRSAQIGNSSTADQITSQDANTQNKGDVALVDPTAAPLKTPFPMPSITVIGPSVSPGSATPTPGLTVMEPEVLPVQPTTAPTDKHATPPTPPTVPPTITNGSQHRSLPTPPPVPSMGSK